MHRIVLAGLLPVLLALPGAAQNPPLVNETEFLSALDDSHPAVAESSEALALARARIVAAATLENPVLGVLREDPEGPVLQMDWTLSWQLPGINRRLTIKAAQEAAEAAAAGLSRRLLALRLRMKEVYANWAFASARHGRLSAQAQRVQALADREGLRAGRGEASGLEAHRLELAASGLRTRAALAAAATEEARARAASWWPRLPADGRPVLPALMPSPELREDHPRVRVAQRELAAATWERKAAGRFVRSPEVLLGWQHQETGVESLGGPTVGLAWSLPVFARNRAEKAAFEASVSGARARLERVRREVESSRSGALARLQHLALALGGAEAALDGNERMLDGAEAAFRHGEVSLTDLLATYRSAMESELVVLDLHQAALSAHRELERVAGSGASQDTLLHRSGESRPQENLP